MIGISKLYCGTVEPSDVLRYQDGSQSIPSHLLQFSKDKKPVVVWNITRRCNLKCMHCYSQSEDREYEEELTTDECKKVIDDLAEFEVPVILFSGGEPLLRKDIVELASYAVEKGIRTVISTNGTLITKAIAKKLKDVNVSFVGISIDGMEIVNDNFRGVKGAFQNAINGIRICKKSGIKVGLRFTINKFNSKEIPDIFKLIVDAEIPRICFYHLVYSGRGSELVDKDLSHRETRDIVDFIIDETKRLFDAGIQKEVLTVDNHTDGVYLYLRLMKENPKRAEEVYELLKYNGGNNSGIAIGSVDWIGDAHPDQFWTHYSLGNVKQRKFSDIWMDESNEVMKILKNRNGCIKGRCGKCRYFEICNGNLRVRAEAITGDIWESDPACYLTDEEIGIK